MDGDSTIRRIPPELLAKSASTHERLCPRQVLGLRIGLLAGVALGLQVPRADKRLLAFVETDGCAADGIAAATGCAVGRRTMRVVDFGKVAATFVDTQTEDAVRIAPHAGARDAACHLLPDAESRWHAQLEGYQMLPDEALLTVQRVALLLPLDRLISKPGLRAVCEACGEEIMNEREVVREGHVLCRGCAGEAYYAADAGIFVPWVAKVAIGD